MGTGTLWYLFGVGTLPSSLRNLLVVSNLFLLTFFIMFVMKTSIMQWRLVLNWFLVTLLRVFPFFVTSSLLYNAMASPTIILYWRIGMTTVGSRPKRDTMSKYCPLWKNNVRQLWGSFDRVTLDVKQVFGARSGLAYHIFLSKVFYNLAPMPVNEFIASVLACVAWTLKYNLKNHTNLFFQDIQIVIKKKIS